MLCIIILGLLILGDLDEFYEIFMDDLETSGHFFGRKNGIFGKLMEFYDESRIIIIISIKQRTINVYILDIVVREFGEG